MKQLLLSFFLLPLVANCQQFVTKDINQAKAYADAIAPGYAFKSLDSTTYSTRIIYHYAKEDKAIKVEFSRFAGTYTARWVTGQFNDLAATWKATFEPGADLATISQKGGTFVNVNNYQVSFYKLKDLWAIKIVDY